MTPNDRDIKQSELCMNGLHDCLKDQLFYDYKLVAFGHEKHKNSDYLYINFKIEDLDKDDVKAIHALVNEQAEMFDYQVRWQSNEGYDVWSAGKMEKIPFSYRLLPTILHD